METKFNGMSPCPSPVGAQKQGEWKNFVAILLLIFLPPIGLVAMWSFAIWSKRTKIIITAIVLILSAVSLGIIFNDYKEISNKTDDSKIVSAISEARTVMLNIYKDDSDYKNFNCQHPDMSSLCQQAVEGGGAINITKDTTSKNVCVWSPVYAKPNYWYCADSDGRAGFTTTNPAGIGYCRDGSLSISCPPVTESYFY